LNPSPDGTDPASSAEQQAMNAIATGPGADLTELTDAEAIARSLTQPRAFEAVFHRHFVVIHRYLARRLGEDLAEELAAETFSIAFARRATFKAQTPDCKAWLYGIAAKLASMHHRGEVRRLRAYARSAERLVGTLDDTIGRLDSQSRAPHLARALADLSARQRDVLLLYAVADLSYPEIATALGISTGTVRSRIHRARAQVSRALEPPTPSRSNS
jgi:RNA polymerase sigma-70 factor, ECF subfamily